jgi:hypothetical protein
VKVELRDIQTIRPYESNPRLNDQAVEAVAKSLREFGFRQPIVVDGEGVIICGHTRVRAAQKLGLKQVPVHVATDMTPAQVKAYRLADNQTASLAEWNYELLPLELKDLQGLNFDLDLLGFSAEELGALLAPPGNEGLIPEEEWLVIRDKVPAIIGRDTWQGAQAMVERRSHFKGGVGKERNRWLLSGVLRCGDCGHLFWGEARHKGRIEGRRDVVTKYYACAGRRSHGRQTCPVPSSIPAEALERWVLDKLAGLVFADGKGVEAAVDRFVAAVLGQRGPHRDTTGLVQQIKEVEATLRAITTNIDPAEPAAPQRPAHATAAAEGALGARTRRRKGTRRAGRRTGPAAVGPGKDRRLGRRHERSQGRNRPQCPGILRRGDRGDAVQQERGDAGERGSLPALEKERPPRRTVVGKCGSGGPLCTPSHQSGILACIQGCVGRLLTSGAGGRMVGKAVLGRYPQRHGHSGPSRSVPPSTQGDPRKTKGTRRP